MRTGHGSLRLALAAACLAAGCGYDFDGPFSQTRAESDAGGASGGADAAADAKGGAAGAGGVGGGGSAGKAGTAGAGGWAGAGGSAGQGGEDCTNGFDDNDDGHTDCQDPLCQPSFRCVPLGGTGWSRPGYQRQYGGDESPTDCGPWMGLTTVHATLQIATNDGCSCGCGPSGGTCSFDLRLHGSSNCLGGIHHQTTTACYVVGGQDSYDASVQFEPGSCPVTIVPELSVPTWLISRDFCQANAAGGGCGDGAVCIPSPPYDDFGDSACVSRDGESECPASYPTKYASYLAFSDTRGCTTGTCDCSSPSGGSCIAALTEYSDPSCLAAQGPGTTLDNGCHALNHPDSVQVTTTSTFGYCAPLGAAAMIGQAMPTGATTICCQSN